MKKLLITLIFFLTPAVLYAQSRFSGTWHFSTQSAEFSGKPTVFSLQSGVYRCTTCVPKIDVPADGKGHPRPGSPYSDTVSVRATDDQTIETVSTKAGKVVGTGKDTVSSDGKTLISEWSFVAANGQEGHGKFTSTRTAPGPEGSHKASGTWRAEKIDDASDSVLKMKFSATDDGLSMSDPTGDSYTAKFDGKDYPYKGDPGTTSVSLKKIDANTIEESDKRDGKVISISRMTVSADGNSMDVDTKDLLRGTSSKFKATKE